MILLGKKTMCVRVCTLMYFKNSRKTMCVCARKEFGGLLEQRGAAVHPVDAELFIISSSFLMQNAFACF